MQSFAVSLERPLLYYLNVTALQTLPEVVNTGVLQVRGSHNFGRRVQNQNGNTEDHGALVQLGLFASCLCQIYQLGQSALQKLLPQVSGPLVAAVPMSGQRP